MIRVPRPPSVHSLSTDSTDPLAAVLRPPSSETEEERKSRLQREAEAKQISDRIDEEISQDEKKFKKRKQDVKVRIPILPPRPHGPSFPERLWAFSTTTSQT